MRVAVLVAHPDDEILWTGGTLLMNPEWDVFVAALCRGSDGDRAPKFFGSLDALGAYGAIADLDDGPGQEPLDSDEVRETILSLLPETAFDLLLTHGPRGEYTRHRRHEEVCRAALELWAGGRLRIAECRLFAYGDGDRTHPPLPEPDAPIQVALPEEIFAQKYRVLTDVYGFSKESWEARCVPRDEAFRPFRDSAAGLAWASESEVP